MPRKARIDAPGALHHIIVRGIEKKAIFRQEMDRKDFLKRFVERVLKEANEKFEEHLQLDAAGFNLDELIDKVASSFDMSVDDLKTSSKNRNIVQARAVLCYLAVRKLRFSCTEVARRLNISPNTVSMAVSRGQKIEDIKLIQKQLLGI